MERMVIPLSRSKTSLSITRSTTFSLVRKAPACRSRQSTRVVLPWSTWAIIATFLISSFLTVNLNTFPFIASCLIRVRVKHADIQYITLLLNHEFTLNTIKVLKKLHLAKKPGAVHSLALVLLTRCRGHDKISAIK